MSKGRIWIRLWCFLLRNSAGSRHSKGIGSRGRRRQTLALVAFQKCDSICSYSAAKAPNKAATTPAPLITLTFPAAAPVDATKDAEADLVIPALWTSPSAAAALVKVGTVLTHDLLILRLSVVTADQEDESDVFVVDPAA